MIKRYMLSLLAIAAAMGTYAAGPGGYLFVTFHGQEPPMDEQIYFALSKDGRSWKKIEEFTFEQPIEKRFKQVSVTFRNTVPYRYYRLVFRDIQGGSHFQLSELDLH